MFGIPAESYYRIVLGIVLLFTMERVVFLSSLKGYKVLTVKDSRTLVAIATIFLIFFIGFRPVHFVFGDSVIYRRIYEGMSYGFEAQTGDILFDLLMYYCSKIIPFQLFCFFISLVYIGCMYIACVRLLKERADILMLFCIGAFSFYPYAVNGLRNGMACSIVILAITYICLNKKKWFIFLLLSLIAIGLHKSTILPIVAVLFASFWKKPNTMFYFWLLSIPLSLAFGDSISSFFSSLGFDDRMASYVSQESLEEYGDMFSSTGFRWDFLLYSFMPILLGWYVIFRRKIVDRTYYHILACYIYSNAFWIMVINSINSNRFAYLSWFIYPIALGYPLLKLPVFKRNHSQKTALILLAHFSFTVVMALIGK